jgi:hypothetical protein
MKIVVFDLDETLGYFTQLGMFWDCLINYLKNTNNYELTQTDFNQILDLYPEFLRPYIINILTYLKTKKLSKCCHQMMIYTNNQGPKQWAANIVSYFESKIHYKLFDQIIAAFKINGKQIEICRTTHDKTHGDFIKCTKVPEDAEICFIDDIYHPGMKHENVYYINLKPYDHDLEFDDIISRFLSSSLSNDMIDNKDNFKTVVTNELKQYNYKVVVKNPAEYDVDYILGKQILSHLQLFFKKPNDERKQRKGTTRQSAGRRRGRTYKKKRV